MARPVPPEARGPVIAAVEASAPSGSVAANDNPRTAQEEESTPADRTAVPEAAVVAVTPTGAIALPIPAKAPFRSLIGRPGFAETPAHAAFVTTPKLALRTRHRLNATLHRLHIALHRRLFDFGGLASRRRRRLTAAHAAPFLFLRGRGRHERYRRRSGKQNSFHYTYSIERCRPPWMEKTWE